MNFPFLLPLNPFFHPRDFRGAWEKRDCATAARDLDSLDKRASPLFTCYFIIGIRISFSLSCTQSIPSHWFTPVARINLVRYETTLSPFIDNNASRVNVIRKRDTWPLSLYPFLSQIRLDTHSILFLIEKPSIDAESSNCFFLSVTRIPRLRYQKVFFSPLSTFISHPCVVLRAYSRPRLRRWKFNGAFKRLLSRCSTWAQTAGWRRRLFFPRVLPDQRASPPASRIAKDFIVMNLIFVQTASPRPLDESSRRCTERERVLRGVGEGWRTLECRAVSRPVTRNPIKLGDANEI